MTEPGSLMNVVTVILLAFIAGGLVAGAAVAVFVLLPAELIGYSIKLTGEMATAIFLAGGILGIVQIARDRPTDFDL